MKRFLLTVMVAVLWCGTASAGIVNNGTDTQPEDSIAIEFQMLDTLGNPVQDASGDSAWLFVWYPSGALAFTDSVRITSDAKITSRQLQAGTKAMEFFNYKRPVDEVDGGGVEGVYKYSFIAYDSSLALSTPHNGEFQVYATADFSTQLDLITTIEGQTDDIGVSGAFLTAIPLNLNLATGTLANDQIDDDVDVDVHTWDGTAAATADNGWVTATGFSTHDVDAIWDEPRAGHTTEDTYGAGIDTLIANGEAILADVTGLNGASPPANWADMAILVTTGEVGINLDDTQGTLDAGEIGADAITAAKIATDAITTDEISQAGGDEIAFYVHNMGNDSAQWEDATDTSYGLILNRASAGGTPPTAAAIVDEWETQSQADPTGFHVNVLEIESLDATDQIDARAAIGDTNQFDLNDTLSLIMAEIVNLDGGTLLTTTDLDNEGTDATELAAATITAVSGAVGSVTGAVGSVTGDVGGNVTGSVGSNLELGPAEVEAEVTDALEADHLDHLFAATYDPTSKPGAADALLNELVENDGGVSRYTANALEEGPAGAGAVFSAAEADTVLAQLQAIQDSVWGQSWWATAAAAGTGPKPITFYFVDTSGVDANVMNVAYVVLDDAQTSAQASGSANSSPGKGTANLAASTDYYITSTVPGYVFPYVAFSTAAGNDTASVQVSGYDISVSSSFANSEGTTLFDYLVIAQDTLRNADVKITLVGNGPFYSTTNLIPSTTWEVRADNSGYFEKWIYGTDSTFNPGSGAVTYTIEVTHKNLVTPMTYTGLTIPAKSAGASTQLRDIIAGQ